MCHFNLLFDAGILGYNIFLNKNKCLVLVLWKNVISIDSPGPGTRRPRRYLRSVSRLILIVFSFDRIVLINFVVVMQRALARETSVARDRRGAPGHRVKVLCHLNCEHLLKYLSGGLGLSITLFDFTTQFRIYLVFLSFSAITYLVGLI